MNKHTFAHIESELNEAGEADFGEEYFFENKRGISVIRSPYSYGGRNGLFEVAILDKDGSLDYDSGISNDVIGWLDPENVVKLAKEVAELP